MSPRTHAVRVGLGRGWTEFVLSLRSPQDLSFYMLMGLLALGYLYLQRDTPVAGTSLLLPSVALPGILGALVVIGTVAGPASSLALEREDGTLLRARAVPHGLVAYVTGQLLLHSVSLLPLLAVVLLPSALLFEGLAHRGAAGWLTVLWVVPLGLLATMPIGIIIGSSVAGVQRVWTWGMFPLMVLAGISGIFAPIQHLWGWVQGIAQVFPMYWVGLGMRSAFLPDAAAAIEIGGSWRSLETAAVLSAWAVVGIVVAPIVLRRAARRQSGAAVQQAREAAAQWVR